MTDYNAIKDALIACDVDKLIGLVNLSLAQDVAAGDILNNGLIAGMDIVGERMEDGSLFIPEVLMAARAMASCVAILKPPLADDESWASTFSYYRYCKR